MFAIWLHWVCMVLLKQLLLEIGLMRAITLVKKVEY